MTELKIIEQLTINNKRLIVINEQLLEMLKDKSKQYDEITERVEALRMEFYHQLKPICEFVNNNVIGIAILREENEQ